MSFGLRKCSFSIFGECLANKAKPLRIELEVTVVELFERRPGNPLCLLVIVTQSFRVSSELSGYNDVPACKTLKQCIPSGPKFRFQ